MTASSLEFRMETLGHLMADRLLTVPEYQRPYAWEKEHVSDFWADLDAAQKDGRQYFIGAVVLTPGPDDRWFVIDGQQRLVTTSLLMVALRDELASLRGSRPCHSRPTAIPSVF